MSDCSKYFAITAIRPNMLLNNVVREMQNLSFHPSLLAEQRLGLLAPGQQDNAAPLEPGTTLVGSQLRQSSQTSPALAVNVLPSNGVSQDQLFLLNRPGVSQDQTCLLNRPGLMKAQCVE